ncbi:MAG: hypothetical protein ETSY1_32250 [Candidatus Entotheonella factor]|uniref:Uncharacterized protein n=1 Tax=Entotheonella factor TaxID=1429438 RepID=W4LCJ3_ENTF1|nr:MAG: hypothetical protein ETSY1_32250 [Candidatus Entotheonella factor]
MPQSASDARSSARLMLMQNTHDEYLQDIETVWADLDTSPDGLHADEADRRRLHPLVEPGPGFNSSNSFTRHRLTRCHGFVSWP